MNSNEKWQGKPAGRDGKPFEKRDVKSILKGSRGAAKFSGESDKRNYNRIDSGNSNETRKPYENRDSRNEGGGEKRKIELRSSGGNSYGERKPYENRNGNTFGERKPYENRGERPQFGERKPYINRGEDSGTPRMRPRKNSFNTADNPNSERKFTIKNIGDSQLTEFVEYRFDNQNEAKNFRKPLRKRDGNYDPNAKYSAKKRTEFQKSYVDLTKPVRLNKFLANAGICSRREADEYIQAGVISVNDVIVTELGTKVMHSDKIMFHNQPIRSERKVYLLLNKPKDCVTTSEDTHDRLTVLDLVKNACSERIYPVGRLDRNTTGVILLTNDGDLASKLTHPKYEKKKIYHVALDKPLEAPDFESILGGVVLDDGKIAADSLEFVKDGDMKQVGIEIHSGQNRVVRRIFEKLGYKVIRLDRVYFAGLTKKSLPRGKYRFLNEREINMLKMGAYE